MFLNCYNIHLQFPPLKRSAFFPLRHNRIVYRFTVTCKFRLYALHRFALVSTFCKTFFLKYPIINNLFVFYFINKSVVCYRLCDKGNKINQQQERLHKLFLSFFTLNAGKPLFIGVSDVDLII